MSLLFVTPLQELCKQSQQLIEESRELRAHGQLRRAQKAAEDSTILVTQVERSRLLLEGRSQK